MFNLYIRLAFSIVGNDAMILMKEATEKLISDLNLATLFSIVVFNLLTLIVLAGLLHLIIFLHFKNPSVTSCGISLWCQML